MTVPAFSRRTQAPKHVEVLELEPLVPFSIGEESGQTTLDRTRELMSTVVDDDVVNQIAQAIEEIHVSVLRIKAEHVAIGSRFDQIYQVLLANTRNQYASAQAAHNAAIGFVNRVAQSEFDLQRSSAYLYIRAYRKFAGNADAIHLLNISEMGLLLKKDITDDMIEQMIDAKRTNPDLSRKEFDELLKMLRKAQDQIHAAHIQTEAAQEELARSEAALANEQIEARSVRAQLAQEKAAREADHAALSSLELELNTRSAAVNKMDMTLTAQAKEIHGLQTQLHEVRVRTDSPAATSAPARDVLEAAVTEKRSELVSLTGQLERARQELEAMNAQAAQKRATIAEDDAIFTTMTQVSLEAERFAKIFETARQAITSSSNAQKYVGLVDSMKSMVGKLAQEINSLQIALNA
jgi:hypothetical protein